MRVLLSTIGSRGEVQPLTALALQLKAFGQEVRVCAPPDFRDWFAEFGIPLVPIGPEVRGAAHIATLREAAKVCDILVGCGALRIPAGSVAEALRIRYVHTSFSPSTLPSPRHESSPVWAPGGNGTRGALDAWRRDDNWGAHGASASLAVASDVRGHTFAERLLLAADPTLAPWSGSADVVQTGAWMLPDWRPLPAELETFLDAGEPPVYFGLDSTHAPNGISQVMVKAARELGRRVIVPAGWPVDGRDSIAIREVNHQALFRRVAAAVHHGGAGTTTTAAYAGAPQVVLPQTDDQHYWALRVDELGIGAAHPCGAPTTNSLATALSRALEPGTVTRAWSVATSVRCDGAQVAARLLTS